MHRRPISTLFTLLALTPLIPAALTLAPAAAQETDMLDGLLRESQCIAWRDNGPNSAQVACLTIDLAHCRQVLVIINVGEKVGEAMKETPLIKAENECSFEGNASLFRAAAAEVAKDWKPLRPKLPTEAAASPHKGHAWNPFGPYAITHDGKRFQLVEVKTKKALSHWDSAIAPDGVWLVEPLNAFIILTAEIGAHSESDFKFKVMQPLAPSP